MGYRTVCCAVVLAAACAAPVAAERLVTIEVQTPAAADSESAEPERYTIWLGDERMREDRGGRSMIVDRAAGKLYVIRHDEKTYHALDLPIEFESMVPPEMLAQWRAVMAARKPTVRVEAGGETDTIRGYDVERYVVEIKSAAGIPTTLEVWASRNPGFDHAALKGLIRELHALQPGASEWIGELFDTIEGYPVRMTRSVDLPDGTNRAWVEELIGVEEKGAPEGAWKPPADYERVEFNLLSAAPR